MSESLFSLKLTDLEHGWATVQLDLGDHAWILEVSDACNCPFTDFAAAWFALNRSAFGSCVVQFYLEPGYWALALKRVADRVVVSFQSKSVRLDWAVFQQSLHTALRSFLARHGGVASDHLWTWPFPFEKYYLLESAVGMQPDTDQSQN